MTKHRFLCRINSYSLVALTVFSLFFSSCGLRKEKISHPAAWNSAKTLTYDEVLTLFKKRVQEHDNLIFRGLSLTAVAESEKQAKREKLPTSPGLLILNRRGDLRLEIWVPVLHTTFIDFVCHDGDFKIWYPRNKTLYQGTVPENIKDFTIAPGDDSDVRNNLKRLRPWHLTQAFFHYQHDGASYVVIQEDSSQERYYVIHELLPFPKGGMRLTQKVWLERSTLQIRKKVIYDKNGFPLSEITYTGGKSWESKIFPEELLLIRPQEGYQVQFKIKQVQADAPLRAQMFELEGLPANVKIETISLHETKGEN